MKNDIITITVERMSSGKKLISSTALPMSIFDYASEYPGSVVWGEIVLLVGWLDEKEKKHTSTPNQPTTL